MFIDTFLHQLSLALPLFSLVLIGYVVMRFSGWPKSVSDGLTLFVFNLAVPVMLFRLMSDSTKRLSFVDYRLLVAFFGGCLIVFVIGRIVSWKFFGLDGVSQSVFGLGCVYSNGVLLGLPLVKMTFGDAAIPSAALVIVFNALILLTVTTVNIEWAKHGHLSLRDIARTARGVLMSPIIFSIILGALFGWAGFSLPESVDIPAGMISQTSTPLALIALGMGLSEYGIGNELRLSSTVCLIKLLVSPFFVWCLAWMLGIPAMETQVVVLLAAVATGASVFLMSRQHKVMEGPIASSLILSTLLAAITIPLILSLLGNRAF